MFFTVLAPQNPSDGLSFRRSAGIWRNQNDMIAVPVHNVSRNSVKNIRCFTVRLSLLLKFGKNILLQPLLLQLCGEQVITRHREKTLNTRIVQIKDNDAIQATTN